jgi:aminopeptidase
MRTLISQNNLEKWASYLLDYSLGGLTPDDVVMVKGEHICWPLISILQDKIIATGAIADIKLVPPDNDRGKVWGASMAKYGTLDQIKRVPKWYKDRYKAMTKYIEVLGSEKPELFANLPEDTSQAIMREDEPFKSIRLAKPWVLTLYPTQGFANLEGMTLKEYTDIIVKASIIDPRNLEYIEEDIYQLMSRSKELCIQTLHPENGNLLELRMSIANRNIIKCTGKLNFPDGEVFTSPDANTVEGEVFVDLPVFYSGTIIEGIYLKFKEGIITSFNAKKGSEALKKIIETDHGSHRLGEVALGMNTGIERALKHPLFVEKVGGTLHIAIGASYPECYIDDPNSEAGKKEKEDYVKKGIMNKSAQHVDIVIDFREGGVGKAVYMDNIKLALRDNIWIVPK